MKLRVLIKEALVVFHWLTFCIILLCSLASGHRALFWYKRDNSRIKLRKNYNFEFSVMPRFTLKSSMLWFAYVSKTFKTDLLRNSWGICSPIVDLKVENSPSHEVKRTNWLQSNSHCKLLRHKVKIKKPKICVIRCP